MNKVINFAKPIINDEEKEAVLKVLDSGMLAQGPIVKELEEKFAKFCGSNYAVALNSGTAALHTALYASGIKAGDEVITTPFTFVATANSIIMQNAKPVFVDIESNYFNIDPNKIEEKITDKTTAIVVVDIYGHIHDYEKISAIAKKHNLKLISDSCQSVGAELNNIKSGNFGEASVFSFYATKNIMCGEGGILTTNDENIAEYAKRFRHHGQSEQTRYEYHDLGYNYRMMDIQAAIALEQLKKVDDFNNKRINNAEFISNHLSKIKGIIAPQIGSNQKHVFHQYTIRVTDEFKYSREKLISKLKDMGINCPIFYPKPLHMHPHFMKYGYKEGDFPVTEKMSKEVMSIPIHPSLSENDLKRIVNAFEEIINE